MNPLLQVGRNCWTITNADETGLLIDGCDYYHAFHQAAGNADRYVLISGWQFDSNVSLVRGGTGEEDSDVPLLAFLNEMCEKRSDLRVYILAWNFNPVYGLDREWFQRWYFNWTTNERLQFCFDSCHCIGASHHQKFAVVDGAVAFLGGLDLCSSRWDDRDHCPSNPRRINSDNTPYEPFHDIQSYHRGAVAEGLVELFKKRWRIACGDELNLPSPSTKPRLHFPGSLPLASHRVAISRTQAQTDDGKQESIQEIRQLFVDAIGSAESIVYIENQYFSSNAVFKSLAQRMKEKEGAPLQIVLVLAKEANAFVEKVSIGIVQAKVIGRLKELAAQTGHKLGVYYTACLDEYGQERPIYIHSKLFSVDDRFLSVGSANINNRSMGLDTEINVTWEATADESRLNQSIRNIRANLLAEHIGTKDPEEIRRLSSIEGLVDYLDHLSAGGSRRLRRHPALDGNPAEYEVLSSIFPEGFPFDLEEPPPEQTVFETISDESDSFFARGITSFKNLLQNAGKILK